ncbi:AAA family ATPase [Vibrio atlanticus]|uniref:AAA family ATPase n=1 Tax=Vibrio atlanticus TaxID=693153 RepID=UPI0022B00E5C|nr:AAA family ATPase [Vibrio atlanticus]MCZ4309683.1 AAA family ATPase [Vibrio atlanticus]
MIIKSFIAKSVHGYLDFNIQFKDDINFLVGHNGSGKTTALKMMTALLSPDMKELAKLPFESCVVEFIDPKTSKHSSIQVSKTDFTLTLVTSLSSEAVDYQIDEIISDDYMPDRLMKEISKLANPILISLDRKFTDRQLYSDNHSSWVDRIRYRPNVERNPDITDPLFGVKQLIEDEIFRINRRKANEDVKLKDKILLDAFKVIDCSNELMFSVGASYDNKELNEKRNLIITTLESLNLKNKNLQDVKDATDTFFL